MADAVCLISKNESENYRIYLRTNGGCWSFQRMLKRATTECGNSILKMHNLPGNYNLYESIIPAKPSQHLLNLKFST